MKLKIVNKGKFIRMISIIIVLISTLFVVFNNAYSNGEIAYKEEYVISGDTLWSLAEKEAKENDYYKNKDVRDIIQEIKYANNLRSSNLEIGQKLLIPTY